MKKDGLKSIIFICISVSLIFVAAYIFNFYKSGLASKTENWGTFGDYIGGVIGTIFNFTGVVLIYLTFKSQEKNANLQQFETTFFNLLNNHREFIKSLNGTFVIGNSLERKKGFDFIYEFSYRLNKDIATLKDSDSAADSRNLITGIYERFFIGYDSSLGAFYRHLYHFIKYTDESEIPNKQKYIDIISAQMSDDEQYCLFYNVICYGSDKFLPLLEKYAFFENISSKGKSFDHHKKLFYPKTKFKHYSPNYLASEIED